LSKVPYEESIKIKTTPLLKQRRRAMDKEMAMLNIRSVFPIIKQEAGMVVV
jgi:hypothetical protein